jgi:hypothetical protein
MRKLMVAAALVAAMGLAAQAASAQTTRASASPEKAFSFGPQVDFATQSIGLGVGARAVYNDLGTVVKLPGLKALASFDYFFPGSAFGPSAKYWEINVNATYDLNISGLNGFAPYVGAGLGYDNWSWNYGAGSLSYNSTGLNILGGGRFKVGQSLHAFAEARFELRSGGALVLTGGLLF